MTIENNHQSEVGARARSTMSTSTHCIVKIANKAQQLASELKSNGVLNDTHLDDIERLHAEINEKAPLEASENPQIWKINCEELLKALTEFIKLIKEYHLSAANLSWKKKADKLEKEVEDLRRQVELLHEKIIALEKKLEESKDEREKIVKSFGNDLEALRKEIKPTNNEMVGLLAYEVEKTIVNYVLTKVLGPPQKFYITTLANLQQVLNREQNFTQPLKDDEKHAEANERWVELQGVIGWQEHHYRRVEFFKRYCAHPTAKELDVSALRSAISKQEAFPHNSECKELLSMIDVIQQLS